MPRPRNSYLLNLFKINEINQAVCNNGRCEGKILYKHSANLERHLKKLHPGIYSSYMKKKKIPKFPRKVNMEKRLIELMHGCPVLWDKSQSDYLNEDLSRKAWEDINHEMKIYVSSMTVDMCKQKWNNLIERFVNELSKISKTLTETDVYKNYTSNWKYYSNLFFMRDQINIVENTKPELEKEGSINVIHIKEETYETNLNGSEIIEESMPKDASGISAQQIPAETDSDNDVEDDDDDNNVYNNNDDDFYFERHQQSEQNHQPQQNQHHQQNQLHQQNEEYHKLRKTKFKFMSEGENTEIDADKMFLLSLLPFLKNVPDRNKLLVRQKIQGVLLEEQQRAQGNAPGPVLIGPTIAGQEFVVMPNNGILR